MTLSDIEKLQPPGASPDALLRPLQLLSLDACASLYLPMRVPMYFGEVHKLSLQQTLADYSLASYPLPTHRRQWVLRALQLLQEAGGRDNTETLVEWASFGGGGQAFGYKLTSLLADIRRGAVEVEIPPRIHRFDALHALLARVDDDRIEELLLPQNLISDWDKKCWAAQYDPREDENTWDPSAWAASYVSGTGTCLAWENACPNPAPSAEELIEIHDWVRRHSRYGPVNFPGPQTLRLPPRLLAEYASRGWIVPSR